MTVFIEMLKTVVLGVVQGVTEWLPISSTGHMLLIDQFLHLNVSEEFKNTFMVVIQLGSILAVIVLYFHKLNPFSLKKTPPQRKETLVLWSKVIVASIPLGIIGFLFEDIIEQALRGPLVIAIALIVYGIGFLILESKPRRYYKVNRLSDLSYKDAFLIGAFQVLALVPGTSRSGSTILGATLLGTDRPVAAEFSFFMAIPAMAGASFLKLLKSGFKFTGMEWAILLVGMLVAFVVSVIVIRMLMDYIKRKDFKVFGYYRIILGIVIIGAIIAGLLK